ncbi:hypothetical protein FHR70_001844 [Microvirga lupini]|uniref:Uncharacterized protein n=1 Tax=Microvirga lupini TaxID=420324 RepID=A0A7W4VKD0_9HYPH|nr:hypothetical protein [Microvirga lupini]MBB3018790.1 hypothetical protein [Microvirga lupini]
MPSTIHPHDLCRGHVQLDRNIVETDLLISRQIAHIERMAELGDDTTRAKAVLLGLGMVLEYWYAHREFLVDIYEQE